ncbi:MAG: hypothetical protein IK032_00535, partial [Bacteroidales bacterium]|nr:hypothetical protein [Bacteroidales bacterium]
ITAGFAGTVSSKIVFVTSTEKLAEPVVAARAEPAQKAAPSIDKLRIPTDALFIFFNLWYAINN